MVTTLCSSPTMAFESRNSVVVLPSLDQVFDSLSSVDNFEPFMRLSPTCHSIEVLSTDQVTLRVPRDPTDCTLNDIAADRPSYDTVSDPRNCDPRSVCTRIRFKMTERVHVLFGLIKNDVSIVGTQIMSQPHKLHIYESNANEGLVEIYKLRRFAAMEQQGTLVEELICGKTARILRHYTQSTCRNAHQENMQQYQSYVR